MTFQPLTTTNTPNVDLTPFNIPLGSKIKCTVQATGVNELNEEVIISLDTQEISILDNTPEPPTEDPEILSISLGDVAPGSPVVGTATIEYAGTSEADLVADGWEVQWVWSFTEGGDGSPYAFVVTLEKTENVFDMTGPAVGGDDIPTTYSPKTVTWTIGSNSPIQHGTYLDGSPWVLDNGDIHLIATTPEAKDKQLGEVRDDGSGGFEFVTENPFTRTYRLHNTVINPDLGLNRRPVGRGTFSSNSPYYAPETPLQFISPTGQGYNPFDGRAYIGYKSSRHAVPDQIGTHYAPEQAWDRSDTLLVANDSVFVYRSVETEMISFENRISGHYSVEEWTDGRLYYWAAWAGDSNDDYPTVEQICILNVVSSVPPANAFRPPANWDVGDRANRPTFTQQETSMEIPYPTKQVYSDDPPAIDYVNSSFNTLEGLNGPGDVGPRFSQQGTDFPSDSGVFLNWRWTQNQMRQNYPMSQTNRGWGTYHHAIDEMQIIQACDPKLDDAYRAKVRIKQAQIGIDAYGVWRSTGMWNAESGGHAVIPMGNIAWAWLVTGQPDEITDVLDGKNFGSEFNDTWINLEATDPGSVLARTKWPYEFWHPGWQRLRQDRTQYYSNINYHLENARVTLTPGTETVLGGVVANMNPPTETIIEYDQMIEFDLVLGLEELELYPDHPNTETLQLKNLRTTQGFGLPFAGDFPGIGALNNVDEHISSGLRGLLVKGQNGVGRVIEAAGKYPKDGQFYSMKDFFIDEADPNYLEMSTEGLGNFEVGETVYQGYDSNPTVNPADENTWFARGEVVSWNPETRVLLVKNIDGRNSNDNTSTPDVREDLESAWKRKQGAFKNRDNGRSPIRGVNSGASYDLSRNTVPKDGFNIPKQYRLYIKGTPCSEEVEDISTHLWSEQDLESGNAWTFVQTRDVVSTPARASHHITAPYRHVCMDHVITVGVIARTIGYENLPYILKLLYDSCGHIHLDPYAVNCQRNQPHMITSTIPPQDEYFENSLWQGSDPTPVRDDFIANLVREIYSPDQPAPRPVVEGVKRTWPDDFADATFFEPPPIFENPEDVYGVWYAKINNNNPSKILNLDGQEVCLPSRGHYTIVDGFPQDISFEGSTISMLGHKEPRTDPIVLNGVPIYHYFKFRKTRDTAFEDAGGIPTPWSEMKDKTLYSLHQINHAEKMTEFKLLTPSDISPGDTLPSGVAINDVSDESTTWTVYYVPTDDSGNPVSFHKDVTKKYHESQPLIMLFANRPLTP